MNYRIVNVRTYVIIHVRAYTHGGCQGTPTASLYNIFDSEKLNVFLCSWRDSNLRPLELESDAVPILFLNIGLFKEIRHDIMQINQSRSSSPLT